MSQPENLWPKDIFSTDILSPEAILQPQADALSTATGGRLFAKIKPWNNETERQFIDFIVSSSELSRDVRIFQVQHQRDLPYPAVFVGSPSVPDYLQQERVESSGLDMFHFGVRTIKNKWVATSPQEFRDRLSEMLTSGAVKGTILSLLAEINSKQLNSPQTTLEFDAEDDSPQ